MLVPWSLLIGLSEWYRIITTQRIIIRESRSNFKITRAVCMFYWLIPLTPTALIYFSINHEDLGFFYFEIIINILVSSSRFIWIPICYESTTIKNIMPVTVHGLTLDVRILQSLILTSKVDPELPCPDGRQPLVTWKIPSIIRHMLELKIRPIFAYKCK